MKKIHFLFLTLAASLTLSAAGYKTYYLYPNGGMPYDNGLTPSQESDKGGWWYNTAEPLLHLYLPNGAQKGLIVSYPGGGYGALAHDCDENGAAWFVQQGFAVAVVKYRIPMGHCEIPLSDACRAIELLRDSGTVWGVDTTKTLGVIGYSAGGHLASTVVTKYLSEKARPDYGILCYPVISFDASVTHSGTVSSLLGNDMSQARRDDWSSDKQVTENTPPCLIAACQDDDVVPVINSVMMFEALNAKGIKAELLCPPVGKHGWNMLSTHFPQLPAFQSAVLQFISEIEK